MFITFEGIDGSGKSTQARLLADHLRAKGQDVVLTREPGGSPGAEEIRALVLQGDPDRWSPETEILLFTAARRDHLEKTIRPALEAGKTVICDRFADSTRVYQGVTRGDLRAKVDTLHEAMIGIEPDLTFLIDIDPKISLARSLNRLAAADAAYAAAANTVLESAKAASDASDAMALAKAASMISEGSMPEDRFETFGELFQQKMRPEFLSLAANNPDRFTVIDGTGQPEDVATRVIAAFEARA